jgi:hypothetical protein
MSTYSTNTFRITGDAALTQNLFSIFTNASNEVIKIRQLIFQMDCTAVLTTVMPIVRVSRITTAPTGGNILTKTRWNTRITNSNAGVVARGQSVSDGGTKTNIVSTPGDTIWQQYGTRTHTAVGQIVSPDNYILPLVTDGNPFILNKNQGLLVHIVAPTTGSNPTTNNYFVSCLWDEIRRR